MLSSIHPFGERSRNNTFRQTATAHVLGSLFGGAHLGLLFGGIGWLVDEAIDLSSDTRTIIIVIAALSALAIEATGRDPAL